MIELHRLASKAMKYHCELFGQPSRILTDSGTQYTGAAFQNFVKAWGIVHMTSSPKYPRSNWFAERCVKPILKIAIKSNQDLDKVLLNLHATDISAILLLPLRCCSGNPSPRFLQGDWMQALSAIMTSLKKGERRWPSTTKWQPGKQNYLLWQWANLYEYWTESICPEFWCPGTVQATCEEPESSVVQTPNGNKLYVMRDDSTAEVANCPWDAHTHG